MNKNIRFKPYLHILQTEQIMHVIKTLHEEVQVPGGSLFNLLIETVNNFPDEHDLTQALVNKLATTEFVIKQLLNKLFELSVIEYYNAKLPEELFRYHRQLLLFDAISPQVQFENNYLFQERLNRTHILVIGIGGIGNFISTALVASGIKKITLVDFDEVEVTNLNRQILFTEQSLGKPKVHEAAKRLNELNSQCTVETLNLALHSKNEFEKLLLQIGDIDYVVLSADKPMDLVLWASELCKPYRFKYIKCGYMAYQGLIGPLLGYDTKHYEEIFESWSGDIDNQDALLKTHNENHIAPSMAASNAILANIAAWELIKDITGVSKSVLIEQRILFNLKTMEMTYG